MDCSRAASHVDAPLGGDGLDGVFVWTHLDVHGMHTTYWNI